MDGKRYDVSRRVPGLGHGEAVYWAVRGGGNFRDHVCTPEGATHKKVVKWVKEKLGIDINDPQG
jgi:hypothetical protein